MNIVLCFPVEDRHVAQIEQACLAGERVINAGQTRIAECLPEADIFCGHAKVPVPWDEVVAAGRLQWIQSSAAGLDHCLVPRRDCLGHPSHERIGAICSTGGRTDRRALVWFDSQSANLLPRPTAERIHPSPDP